MTTVTLQTPEVPEDWEKKGENDRCVFYSTPQTKNLDNWATNRWNLKGVVCLVAQQKDDPRTKDYILTRDGQIIFDSKKLEDISCHIDFMGLHNKA